MTAVGSAGGARGTPCSSGTGRRCRRAGWPRPCGCAPLGYWALLSTSGPGAARSPPASCIPSSTWRPWGSALGSLVDKHSHGVDGVTYVAFLAPGLLAATVMQIGANDATYPVMGAIKWMRTYLAPCWPRRSTWTTCCSATWPGWRPGSPSWSPSTWPSWPPSASSYSPLGRPGPAGRRAHRAWPSPPRWPPSPPPRTTTPAFSTLYRFGVIPLFLFSGTFFPVSQLPRWLQVVAYITPLYHGVGALPGPDPRAGPRGRTWAHVAYLCAWAGLGYAAGPAHLRQAAGRVRRSEATHAAAGTLDRRPPGVVGADHAARPPRAAATPPGSSSATSSSTGARGSSSSRVSSSRSSTCSPSGSA